MADIREAETKASTTDILPVGSGRFCVRDINPSTSRSMIWLNPFEAPDSKYPPKHSHIKSPKTMVSAPMAYPITEEITTKMVSRILVNAAYEATLALVRVQMEVS